VSEMESGARSEQSTGGAGWIKYIYIKPEYRRKAFGVQLLGQAISDFRNLKKEKIRIDVPKESALHCFCLKYGFSAVSDSSTHCLMEMSIINW